MNSDRMQRKTVRKKKVQKYPWVVQNPEMKLKMNWDELSEEEGMQQTTQEVQELGLQTDNEQVAEVEVQQEEESELARVARQIRVRMEREEREAQVRHWPMTQQTEQPLQLDGMRSTSVPHRPFLTIEQCFNWPDELLVPTDNQQLNFDNWDSDSEPLEPQPRVVYDSIGLFPTRRCLLTDCIGFQASSTNNSRKTVPSLECPPGVEQFEPKAVDPITMLADSNLLNHYLAQCLRCEIKQRTRQIQRQRQQQRDAIEQSSSDVIISNPNGSFAFALKDGCNSRLIWPADCLCLVCPAANAQQFSSSIGNAQEKNPQVRRLSDWERLAICHKLSPAPGSLLLQFSDAETLNAYSKVFSFLAPAPLELFSGNKHFGADDVRLFWHMRWVSQPVATGDSDHEATVQLSDGLLANWAIRVLAANGLIAARRTRRDPSNQPEVSRKIFIVQGIPMSLSTNPLFSHYVETILRANSIEVESVVLDRDGGYHYSVPISRELGKIKRKLFQESREIRVYLSPDLVHPNVDPNDLEQVAQFFENPHVHFPFEVKKGWTYWLQEDGGQRIWFDATGIPIEPKHDSTAELEWRDQQLAERFTDHFARLTPNPLKWRMRRRDNMGVRLTFGYRTTLFISKAVRIACDAQLRQLDEDLRLRRYPEDLPQLRDALTERERYWAQLVDMRSRQQPFETHDQDCPVQLIVEGYPRALFEEALNEVKQILAGVPLDCSDMEREGRLMHGIGLRWLKAELEKEENRCVAIDVNALRRTITFWGGTDQVDQLVNKAVHFANHSESYYIEKSIAMTPPNYPANFRSIIEGIGIQELREITGGAQFSTDDTDENGWETLIFRGSIAQFGRLEAFLQVILRELPPAVGVSTTFNYVQSCPVCFTPVTKSTGLTLTSCSHSYCLDCFINMVANKVQSRDLNFICLKEDCNIPIAIKHIMRVVVGPPSRIKSLDAAKLEPLLRALKDSIACGDTDTMRVCPTPDCFGLIPVPEEGFPIYKIRCDECGKKRCSGRNCVQPPHKGLTCEVAERIRGDADESLRVYGDRIGQDRLKKCPSCTMVIEKQLGCNHMECAKCKIHFCWLCGFQSKERSELYRHLGDTHQGYGGGFQIQGDQLVQINGEEEPIDPMNFVILEDVDGIEAGPWNVRIW